MKWSCNLQFNLQFNLQTTLHLLVYLNSAPQDPKQNAHESELKLNDPQISNLLLRPNELSSSLTWSVNFNHGNANSKAVRRDKWMFLSLLLWTNTGNRLYFFFFHYFSLRAFKSLIYRHWTKTSHGPVSREIFYISNTFFQAPPKMESSDLPYGLMRASVCEWNLEANHCKAEDLVHLAEWSK